MNFVDTHLLSLILFLPSIAAVVILFLPKEGNQIVRWFAFGASLIPFLLSLVAWLRFDSAQPGFQFESLMYGTRPSVPPFISAWMAFLSRWSC